MQPLKLKNDKSNIKVEGNIILTKKIENLYATNNKVHFVNEANRENNTDLMSIR